MLMEIPISDIRADGGTQLRVQIDLFVVEDYKEAILDGTALPDITVFFDGSEYWLADGFHRVEATKRAGRTAISADVREGTRRDAILYSAGANKAHGLRRTNADKRLAVSTILKDPEWSEWSDGEIARWCGVSQRFVTNMRTEIYTQNGSEYRERKFIHPKTGRVTTMNTARIGSTSAASEEEYPEELEDPEEYGFVYSGHLDAYVDKESGNVYGVGSPVLDEEIKARKPHVSFNAGNSEWFTPTEYIEAARDVLGEIDLDPASHPIAQQTIQASTFYTREEDGLSKDWQGRVWLNPPYAADLIGPFIEKLCYHLKQEDVTAALVLVNNATETSWFQAVASLSRAICFPKGRVRFLDAEGNPGAPLQGQAVLYCGDSPERFCERFSSFGFCLRT